MNTLSRFFLVLLSPFLLHCQPESEETSARNSSPQFAAELPQCKRLKPNVIYGNDDRRDWWQSQGRQKNYWAASSVALFDKGVLSRKAQGGYSMNEASYGTQMLLCEDTPFYDQPLGSYCSGFLVSPNRIVTAAHCISNQIQCEETDFAFDYAKRTPNQDTYEFRPQDVYSCKRVVHTDLQRDISIIELTSTVVGRVPLNIRRSGQVSPNDELVLIGHPVGLPSKISGGGQVIDSNGSRILASIDAFVGNSGSVVMGRRSGLVEGVLVRGEPDYIFENGCNRENICSSRNCTGEELVPIQALKDFIPDVTYEHPLADSCDSL